MKFFITGTDTDVGKTVITGCLAKGLKDSGHSVCVYKPIQCGDLLDGEIKSPDLAQINKMSGVDVYNDYAFKLAASPHLAAEQESITIDVERIKKKIEELEQKYQFVLIEGAGGLLVPINNSYTMGDLIKDLDVETILVTWAGLGTINHTLLTLEAMTKRNIKLKGVIFNGFKGGLLEEDNQIIINEYHPISVLGSVPHETDLIKLAQRAQKHIRIEKLI